MSEIVMPRLSDTMEEGTILRWLRSDGELLARGDDLVEIETDKAAMVYQSDQAGTLQISAAEGSTLPVGAPIAQVGAPAGDTAAPRSADAGETAEPASARETAEPAQQGEQAPAVANANASPPLELGQPGARIKASPLARRVARESGIELRGISGSGPGGRIVRADLPALNGEPARRELPGANGESPASGAPASSAAAPVSTAKGETSIVELSRTQQTIARRMAESKATIPDFTIQAEVDMEDCVALRSELKRLSRGASSEGEGDPPTPPAPTYNDMIVKACALALREHPRANGSYRDGALQLHSRINVGVAVAGEDALVVPTVFDAEEKSLGEIARETRRLAERVRARTITPPELGGGTFTVSNLGMYGVRSFTAIVNPPQAAILSVGALEPRAVVRDGELIARHTVALTLVCDHRVLYGADAALFLARIRELLETPSALSL